MQHCEISYYFSISVTTVGVHIDKPHSFLALQNMKYCALLVQLDNSEVVVSYTIVEYRERNGGRSRIDMFMDLLDLWFWHTIHWPRYFPT